MLDKQILEWQWRIEELQEDIYRLEKRLEQCKDAINSVKMKQQEYDEVSYMQKRIALKLYDDFSQVQFAKHYGLCAEQILNETRNRKIVGYFEEVVESVHIQRDRIEDEIQEDYRQIRELELQIEDAKRQRELENMQW